MHGSHFFELIISPDFSSIHGSHIFGLTNFPDFSPTSPVFSFNFPVFFFTVLFNEFNKYKNLLTNTLQLKREKIKIKAG